MAATSGKNLPAFLQHLAAFSGQMRNPRTVTCSVQYQLRCGILPHPTTRCSILPHPTTRCSILPHPTTRCSILPHPATRCSILPHPVTRCKHTTASNNAVQHTSSRMVTVQARTVGAPSPKRPSIREVLAPQITSLSIKL